MLAGLVLTSISTVMLRAALFQRKSRSGWLEELDGIREDALEEHQSGADVVDAEGIWTDLRDGGEYADPHEIASLYATDATPDRPVTKPPAKPAPKARSKAKASAPSAPPPPAPPAPPVSAPPVEAVAEVADDVWTSSEAAPGTATQYDDQIWVQPAPHPMRPSEMWHPAELAPAPLGEESFDAMSEERVTSAELADPVYDPTYATTIDPSVSAAPVTIDDQTATELESELFAAAEVPVTDRPATDVGAVDGAVSSGLVNGPVGRRVRRDRPAERSKASLPPPAGQEPSLDRGEQSPLPTHPLPPAALPTRSNRLPSLESLPATPSSVIAPRSISPFDRTPTGAALPEHAEPAPLPEPAQLVEPAVQPEPTPPAETFDATALVIEEQTIIAAAVAIAIGEDGLVDAPGTIVRIGGERRARATGDPTGVVVELDHGWCWASPGEGAAAALRIDLPTGSLTVDPGATALAVVEGDGSVFIIVAAGAAHLDRGGDGAPIERGTIVMIDPSGVAQTDAASDHEIEADPIVAENLALDAEL